jgi:hypothetical protein
MKNSICLVLFVVLTLQGYTQTTTDWPVPYNKEKSLVIYEEVVDVPDVLGTELYDRAFSWITTYFTNGANKITKADKPTAIIQLKDRMQLFKIEKKVKVVDAIIDYKIDINFKDGKYRYQFHSFRIFEGSTSPFIETWMDPNKCPKELAMERFTNLNTEVQKTLESLKKAMSKAIEEKKDIW